MPRIDVYDHAILGVGCAGLSLAAHMLDAGLADRRVVLIDPRTEHGRDRTWCFFDVGGNPFRSLASHTWPRIAVADARGMVTRDTDAHPYAHLPSKAFYEAALARIASAPSFELRLGTRATTVREERGCVTIETDRGPVHARTVFDGRPPPVEARSARREVRLLQAFEGWFVRTPRPAFDPGVATLMDFRVDQRRGIHFVYTLPFSDTEALVEDTIFAPETAPREWHEASLRAHLEAHGVATYEITHRERGVIPMSAEPVDALSSPRVMRIGLAGGLARPATGYAFLAIQRFSAALASALATSSTATLPAPPSPHRRRTLALDRVFLQHLSSRPASAPAIFTRLFERVPTDALARFLSDASTLADDARVVSALPPLPFTAAAARAVAAWVG